MSKHCLSISLILALCYTSLSLADEHKQAMEVHGFATQGFFLSNHNNFNGNSKSGSFDFRELGVNTTWYINSNLFMAAQLISHKAGKVDNGSIDIDYALVDYNFISSTQGNMGIKLGRIKNPYGFYNQTRDAAFTRPSILLPQSIYFAKVRDFQLSTDGILIYGNYFMPSAILESELLIGRPRTKEKTLEYAMLGGRDWSGEFSGGKSLIWRTVYSLADYSWEAALTLGKFTLDFDAPDNLLNPMSPHDGSYNFDIGLLSLRYNGENWRFTTEYTRRNIDQSELGGVIAIKPRMQSESYSLQLEYLYSQNLTFFTRFDAEYTDMHDRKGEKLARITTSPSSIAYSKDLALGVGWHPSENWLLRAEWHKIKGTAMLAAQDNPDISKYKESWDLFALQATYRF